MSLLILFFLICLSMSSLCIMYMYAWCVVAFLFIFLLKRFYNAYTLLSPSLPLSFPLSLSPPLSLPLSFPPSLFLQFVLRIMSDHGLSQGSGGVYQLSLVPLLSLHLRSFHLKELIHYITQSTLLVKEGDATHTYTFLSPYKVNFMV